MYGVNMSKIAETVASASENRRYGVLFDLLRKEYTERGRPLKGTFELTPECTLDCRMCYVHSSKGQYRGRVLSGEEWIRIIDSAVDAGMLYSTVTGGECFLHPEFRQIYEHLKSRGVYVIILSNGTLIDRETAEWLSKLPPRYIRVSVYGSNGDVYEKVTGSASAFDRVDRALDLLREYGIITDISVTVSRYNYEDAENIIRYARSKTDGNINLECDLFAPRDETGRRLSDFALTYDEQKNVWESYYRASGYELAPSCPDEMPPISAPPLAEGEEARNAFVRMPCTAGLCSFSVGYSGDMQPCAQLPLARAYPLEEGFEAAWEKVNRAGREYLRSAECRDCAYFGACRFCPASYALASGGKNGLPGDKPCNKKLRILPSAVCGMILQRRD